MSKTYTYEEFLEIIETLRSDHGCPWDREQTHQSLRACVMEEAAELVAAIRIYEQSGDSENMQEELGDLLLQVVLHSQIAKEEGLFNMEDVVSMVAEKMIRRHPHVFGDGQADTSSTVLEKWEDIKKKEKEGKAWVESPLKEIPRELPALTRAPKVLKKVYKYYEKQGDYQEILKDLNKTVSQLEKLQIAEDDKELSDVIGNILIQLSDIARVKKLALEQILTDKIEDIIEQYE